MKTFFTIMAFSLLLVACNSNNTSEGKETAPREVKQYTIDQFYKSSEVFGGDISDDDKKMLVTSNENGIYNAYEIDIASAQKRALTNSSKESIFANNYVPGTTNIIYSSDKGGNEISHLYLLKASGEVKDLTRNAKEKANFRGWSRDNKYLYYSSNKRDSRYFDLYKMDTVKWGPEMIYKNDKGFDVGAISKNERYENSLYFFCFFCFTWGAILLSVFEQTLFNKVQRSVRGIWDTANQQDMEQN